MTSPPIAGRAEADSLSIRADPDDPGLFRLAANLYLPAAPEKVFAFFADPRQLETLTPPWIRLRMEVAMPFQMRPGAVIDCRLRIRGLPIRWLSVIPIWEPPHRFIDEQERGPFRYWRHEHLFEPAGSGTLVRDRIDYRVPGGRLIHRLFVRPDVERIFRYRLDKLKEIFGERG
jgi:ligand-binding SRPBCC domain-containing protein